MNERVRPVDNRGGLRRGLRRGVDYLRVSPQLVLPNALLLSPIVSLVPLTEGRSLVLAPVLLPFLLTSHIKAQGNLNNYSWVKSKLEKYGWNDKIVGAMMGTWCDRYAARKAAIDAGYRSEVKDYYKRIGNSWLTWHYGARRTSA